MPIRVYTALRFGSHGILLKALVVLFPLYGPSIFLPFAQFKFGDIEFIAKNLESPDPIDDALGDRSPYLNNLNCWMLPTRESDSIQQRSIALTPIWSLEIAIQTILKTTPLHQQWQGAKLRRRPRRTYVMQYADYRS